MPPILATTSWNIKEEVVVARLAVHRTNAVKMYMHKPINSGRVKRVTPLNRFSDRTICIHETNWIARCGSNSSTGGMEFSSDCEGAGKSLSVAPLQLAIDDTLRIGSDRFDAIHLLYKLFFFLFASGFQRQAICHTSSTHGSSASTNKGWRPSTAADVLWGRLPASAPPHV